MKKYIYKYFPDCDLSYINLKNNQLFFGYNHEFNDPTEFNPSFVFSGEAYIWENFSYYIMMKLDGLITNKNIDLDSISSKNINEYCSYLTKNAKNKKLKIEDIKLNLVNFFKKINEINENILNLIDICFSNLNDLMRKKVSENLLCSFSLNCNNPTMWGHYASKYKGFVLIFEVNDNKFELKRNELIRQSLIELISDKELMEKRKKILELDLQNVIYSKSRPKFNAFDLLIPEFSFSEKEEHYDVPLNLKFPKFKTQDNGLVKFKEWEYEKEIRIVIPSYLFSVPFQMNAKIAFPQEYRAIEYVPDQLIGVIFGSRASYFSKERIYAAICCNKNIKNESISFISAQEKDDDYFFEFRTESKDEKTNYLCNMLNEI